MDMTRDLPRALLRFLQQSFCDLWRPDLLTVMSLHCLSILMISLLSLLSPSTTYAQEKTKSHSYYSDEVSRRELTRRGWRVHPQPEGKQVGRVHIINLPVFLPDERLSSLTTPLNYLHITTRRATILRESRVKVQQLWSRGDALETERNLRNLSIFTSARVYPVFPKPTPSATSTAQPSTEVIDVLIVTRDLWSLRLENSFSYNGGVLNNLNLSLSERNLLGRRILLSGYTSLNPFTMTYGGVVNHRRFGPDLNVSVGASGTWNRETLAREGEGVSVTLTRPLYHLDQAWSFGVTGGVGRQLARITQGAVVITEDDPSTDSVEAIPIEWELRSWAVSASATRQWRGAYQRALSFGVGVSQSERTVFEGVSEALEERWRQTYLPPDRFQVGPSVSFSWYRRTYIALTDVSTYGLREDLRTGPSIKTSHQLVVVGDRAYIPSLSLGYATRLLGRGFISTGISASARVEGRDSEQVVNRSVGFGLKWAAPLRIAETHLGFFVGRAALSERWRDVSNVFVSLGGDTGLRGYPNGSFTSPGGGVSRNNFEYRTPPWKWSFLHLGMTAFYEGGSVHQKLSEYQWKQSVGGGFRFLFPQLNRSVFRVDLAAPLSNYPTGLIRPAVVLSIGSAQGFGLMPWEGS